MRESRLFWQFFLVHVLLALFLLWPLPREITTALNDDGDPVLNTFILEWNFQHFNTSISEIFHAPYFYPEKYTLAYSEHLFGGAIFAWPVWKISGNPVLAYNVLLIGSFIFCGIGMGLWVYRLTRHRPAALLAGILFAYCPYKMAHLSHLQLQLCHWIPWTFYFADRFLETNKWREGFLATLCYILQCLSCGYYAVYFSWVLLFCLLCYGLQRGRRLKEVSFLVKTGLLACLALLILIPLEWPHYLLLQTGGKTRELLEVQSFSVHLDNLFANARENILSGQWTAGYRKLEGVIFPGWVTLFLGAGFFIHFLVYHFRKGQLPLGGRLAKGIWIGAFSQVILCLGLFIGVIVIRPLLRGESEDLIWRVLTLKHLLFAGLLGYGVSLGASKAWRQLNKNYLKAFFERPFRWSSFLVLLAGISFLGALGPKIMFQGEELMRGPYSFFYEYLPGFKGLRSPARLGLFMEFAMVSLAGITFARLCLSWKDSSTRRFMVLGCMALAVVELACVPLPVYSFKAPQTTDLPWAPVIPKDVPILHFPLQTKPTRSYLEAQRMHLALAHKHPIFNGFSGYSPPDYFESATRLAEFPGTISLNRLGVLGIHHVVIHLDEMKPVDAVAFNENLKQNDDLLLLYEDSKTLVAQLAWNLNEPGNVLEVCKAALAEDPLWLFALEKSMELRLQLNDQAGYDSDLKLYNRNRSRRLSNEAAKKFWQESFGRSLEIAHQAVLLDEANVEAYLYRGLSYRKSGEDQKALSDLNRVIELQPDEWLAWSGRAKIWKNRGDLNQYQEDTARAEALREPLS